MAADVLARPLIFAADFHVPPFRLHPAFFRGSTHTSHLST